MAGKLILEPLQTRSTLSRKLPDSYDFWRQETPLLHAMSFDDMVAKDMVILGYAEAVANAILRLSSRLDLIGLAMIFNAGAMPTIWSSGK